MSESDIDDHGLAPRDPADPAAPEALDATRCVECEGVGTLPSGETCPMCEGSGRANARTGGG